jgi:hypothetical protein
MTWQATQVCAPSRTAGRRRCRSPRRFSHEPKSQSGFRKKGVLPPLESGVLSTANGSESVDQVAFRLRCLLLARSRCESSIESVRQVSNMLRTDCGFERPLIAAPAAPAYRGTRVVPI